LFGTDHPYITLERWRRDFETLDVDPETLAMILKGNALGVLGISAADR
jgi:predicted TIM-barrel fold metal-dependent hydrolase